MTSLRTTVLLAALKGATALLALFLLGILFIELRRFMIWTKLQELILAYPWSFLFGAVYVGAAAVNALNDTWDGFYNWFYRFTHILMNARIVQTVEGKFGSVSVQTAGAAVAVVKETK